MGSEAEADALIRLCLDATTIDSDERPRIRRKQPKQPPSPPQRRQRHAAQQQQKRHEKTIGSQSKSSSMRKARSPMWSVAAVAGILRRHPLPVVFGACLLFFMGVEYTIGMVPSSAPPLDVGFVVTRSLNAGLAARPALNSVLAALNTVFVVMQAAYIIWVLLVEWRPRATIAALFMFTCRGLVGCATQLPLPEGFLGSGMDFPVGNVSFFLFFSGHVAGAVIASLDMRRVGRYTMAWGFDVLNLLQGVRLLASRGHYTIDLAVGVGAGLLFDMLAAKYVESKKIGSSDEHLPARLEKSCCTCQQALLTVAS